MRLKEFYKKIGVEYVTIIERFCNNESMLLRFVTSFPDDITYQKLTEAVDTLDYIEIEHCAHALKGISANLGFGQLQDACSELVLDVRKKRHGSILQNFDKVKQEYEIILKEIQCLL